MKARRAPLELLAVLGTLFLVAALVMADNSAYQYTAHSSKDTGANFVYTPSLPNDTTDSGSCQNCHLQHAQWNDGGGTLNAGAGWDRDLLMADPDDNLGVDEICFKCHTNANKDKDWPGRSEYIASRHGTSANMLWPGTNPPARPAGDVNLCVNCHNPHGRRIADADNLTNAGAGWSPNTIAWKDMLIRQEENLCLNCHDGAPAADNVNGTLALGANDGTVYYNHPISRDAVANDRTPYYHTSNETGSALTSANRHVECEDCHSPHRIRGGSSVAGDSRAGAVLFGAWGVRPTGGWPAQAPVAGTNTLPAAPAFTAETIQWNGTDTSPEYFLCLRCHSSYSQSQAGGWPTAATGPNSQTDVSREINPNNLAHHAIVQPGKLQGKHPPDTTFVAPWNKRSTLTCSNCHRYKVVTSPWPRGPHGSANTWILDGYDTTAVGLPNNGNEVFCFNCHRYNVYYSGVIGSRFTHPGNGGHQTNLPWTGIWCMNCHSGLDQGGTHGSNRGTGGTGGASNLGEHFMNGAAIDGHNHDDGGGKFTCYTKGGVDWANTSGCNNHTGGGKQTTFNPTWTY